MSPTPIVVPRFGALRLGADLGDLGWGGAAGVSNVEFDLSGTLRVRPGYDQTDANTLAAAPAWLARNRLDSQYVLFSATDLRAYNSSFVSVDSDIGPVSASHAMEYGSTTAGVLYIIESSDGLAKWDGATYTNLGGGGATPAGKFLAVQPNDNRLVISYADGVSWRVRFSGAGTPETYAAEDFVDLHPNDGQAIRMIVSWGNNLFVFKDQKFFVFHGNSVDSAGGVVFNYRTEDTGVSCGYDYAACAARDGVYFVHADGVYRTQGGTPELVSGAIQPFFDQRTNGIFTPVGPLTSPRIHAGDDRLYVWQQGATGMFVMDLRSREWTYWVLGVAPYALLPLPDPREFIFANSTGQLYKFSPDFTDDDGTAIASSYQSGFLYSAEGDLAEIHPWRLTGTGTVTLSLAADHGAVNTSTTDGDGKVGPATSIAMGTSPAIADGTSQQSAKCRALSFKISATSGAWAVNRLRTDRQTVVPR